MTFLYNLLAAYLTPGMMLAFGICLFFLSVPRSEGLRSYVLARKVMGLTFVVYGLALIFEAVSRKPLAGDLLNSMIVVAISTTQAFLFTCSLITLVDTGFLTRRKSLRETLMVVAGIVVAFLLFAFCPPGSGPLVFCGFSVWYVSLLTRYVLFFRRYYSHYRLCMDNYFSDDERQRLRWVPLAFYSAAGVGALALLFAWLITPFTQVLFMVTATVYYSVFAVKFMNYVHVFPKIAEPLSDVSQEMSGAPSEPLSEGLQASDDDRGLMERIEQLMRDRSLFRKPDLSIATLASLCGKNHRIVSAAINHCRGVNFKTYINEYRVEEAERLIEAGWLRRHTLDALAEETGFAGRVNLYRAFKRKTGVSPTEWETQANP